MALLCREMDKGKTIAPLGLELLGQIIASLHFKTENELRLYYANCDFDQFLAHFSKVA